MLKKSINAALWFRKKCPVPVLDRLPLRGWFVGAMACGFVPVACSGDGKTGLLK